MKVPRGSLPMPNMIDKIITVLSPQRGLARHQARMALMFSGGYTGARTDRPALKQWMPSASDADDDTNGSLPNLRSRSRDLERNEPIACGAIGTQVNTVVGTGLVPQSRIDREFLGLSEEEASAYQKAAERYFWWWAGTTACDVGGRLVHAAQQELVFRSMLVSGDILAVRRFVTQSGSKTKPRKGELLATKLQLIEADRVCNKNDVQDTDALSAGVHLDEFGGPKAYDILNQHPNAYFVGKPKEWKTVDAFGPSGERQVLHIYKMKRPGQTRGVPFLAPVIETVRQLGRYSEAEIQAAVISAFFTVFVKKSSPNFGDGPFAPPIIDEGQGSVDPNSTTPGSSSAIDREARLGSGAIVELDDDQDISIANPGRPNAQFEPFFNAVVMQIGIGLNIPFEVLMMSFKASYSASKAALLQMWQFARTHRQFLVDNFCQPAYEMVITEAVARGYLDAPGFFDDPLRKRAYLEAEWTGPPAGEIDEVKAVEAAKGRYDLGVSTLAEETVKLTGGDWETKHEQQKRERRMRREAGLDTESVAERTQSTNADDDTKQDQPEAA